jgi:sugar lactone lactonase YvrE
MKGAFKLVFPACVLLSGVINAQATKTIKGFNHIESVASDGKFIYVADIGKELNPTAKDGDGKIFKLDLSGKVLDSNLVKEPLNAPKGLAIDNGILFAADVDRIVAIEIKTGKKLYEIDFGNDASFLNDITIVDKNTLFVSATDKSKIFKVNLANKTYSELLIDKPITGANGLFLDKKSNRLYANGFGSDNKPNGIVGYIDLSNNKFTQLPAAEGYYDGIYLADGILYTSNWVAFEKKGIIQAIDLKTNKVSVVKMKEPIAGPADFIIFKGQFIIPEMMTGTLNFIQIIK